MRWLILTPLALLTLSSSCAPDAERLPVAEPVEPTAAEDGSFHEPAALAPHAPSHTAFANAPWWANLLLGERTAPAPPRQTVPVRHSWRTLWFAKETASGTLLTIGTHRGLEALPGANKTGKIEPSTRSEITRLELTDLDDTLRVAVEVTPGEKILDEEHPLGMFLGREGERGLLVSRTVDTPIRFRARDTSGRIVWERSLPHAMEPRWDRSGALVVPIVRPVDDGVRIEEVAMDARTGRMTGRRSLDPRIAATVNHPRELIRRLSAGKAPGVTTLQAQGFTAIARDDRYPYFEVRVERADGDVAWSDGHNHGKHSGRQFAQLDGEWLVVVRLEGVLRPERPLEELPERTTATIRFHKLATGDPVAEFSYRLPDAG